MERWNSNYEIEEDMMGIPEYMKRRLIAEEQADMERFYRKARKSMVPAKSAARLESIRQNMSENGLSQKEYEIVEETLRELVDGEMDDGGMGGEK